MDNQMITRRNILKASMAGATTMFLPALNTMSATSGFDRPNVLMIIADDMNDYGLHSSLPGIKMPYLHKFKQTAVTFERAYCAAPACVPSRPAVFSGLYPHNTGSYLSGSDPCASRHLPRLKRCQSASNAPATQPSDEASSSTRSRSPGEGKLCGTTTSEEAGSARSRPRRTG